MPLDGDATKHLLPGLPNWRVRFGIYACAICALAFAAYAFLANA